jgi:hypothetical protein
MILLLRGEQRFLLRQQTLCMYLDLEYLSERLGFVGMRESRFV